MKQIKDVYGAEMDEAKYLVADGTVTEKQYIDILRALYEV